MGTSTYVALDKVTTTGSVSSIEFTGISSAYTDLRIVIDVLGVGTGYVTAQFNNNTGTNYSITRMGGNGSTATSYRATDQTSCDLSWSAAYTSSGRLMATVDLLNYSNTTTFKNLLSRAGKSDNAVDLIAGMFRSTSAITSIKLIAATSNFAAGSTFSLYGISAANADSTPKAVGGAVTSDATYYYHTFRTSGNFVPNQTLTCDYLIVGGGGGGGAIIGGGGGAGGYRPFSSTSITAATYPVVIGAGGHGGWYGGGTGTIKAASTAGSASTFNGSSAAGGGGGAYFADGSFFGPATSGGSGGGGSRTQGAGSGNTPSTSPSQGNSGGTGQGGAPYYNSGGGGGAGAVGGNAGVNSGSGGAGLNWQSLGTFYAGGGGGAPGDAGGAGAGGTGGGGAGVAGVGVSGTSATGGGGGGGHSNGGTGGGGVVIIRYAKA